MERLRAAVILSVAVVYAVVGSVIAIGTHWEGSITTPLDNSRVTQYCHDTPYWFKPEGGWWSRSCPGAVDIGNAYTSANLYLRGWFWDQALVTAVREPDIYYNNNCTNQVPPPGKEYGNAYEVYITGTGTAGAAFHHMSNYHYALNSWVPRGAHVGEQANWGTYPVYYCSGVRASTAPHVHWEAATAGALVDRWGWYNPCAIGPGCNTDPYVNFRHP